MTTTTNTAGDPNRNEQIVPIGKLWRVGLIAAAGASLANLALYWVAKAMFGISFIIPMGGPSGPLEPLPAGPIVFLNVVPAIGGTILLALLGKYVARPIRLFWIISGVLFLLSFALPITLPAGIATSTKIGLSLMHPITWGIIGWVLTTRGREK
ncbi:MAG: hypothetical protein IIA59_04465 [Candidatus Marinimicrobia bacterium]|nr:hypothetical protein [Candidatus Neomarinimicrobiota bacterium]